MDFELVDNLTAEQRVTCARACTALVSLMNTYAAVINLANEDAAKASEAGGEVAVPVDVHRTTVSQFQQFLKLEILVLEPAALELACNTLNLQQSDLACVFDPVVQVALWRYWPVALATLLPQPESPPEWAQVTFTVGQQNQKVIQVSASAVVQPGHSGGVAMMSVLNYNLSMHLQQTVAASLASENWEQIDKTSVAVPSMPGFTESLEALRKHRYEAGLLKTYREAIAADEVIPFKLINQPEQPPSGAIGIADSSEIGQPGIVMGPPPAKIVVAEVIVPPNYPGK